MLGNLPRSRPGTRSPRRGPAGRKRTVDSAPPGEADRRGNGPSGGALRAVAGAAGAGVRVAGAVSREVLRRLPRP